MSEQSPISQPPLEKRVRRERQDKSNDGDDDGFWENNPYFNQDDMEDDDSQDYEPQAQSNQSQEGSSSDDYVDSLQWEDVSQSEKQSQKQSQKSQINLLRHNLKSYSTMRGLHSMVDISTLTRIGNTSYVYYNDQQTYTDDIVLNRYYKSVPESHDTGYDEQEKTKTEFHSSLYKLEDKRYFIDIELNQLKRLQKIISKNKFSQFLAFRKLQTDQQLDLDKSIDKQIIKLQQMKQHLLIEEKLEKQLYNLSIDQLYYNKLKTIFAKCTPRQIQEISNLQAKLINNSIELPKYQLEELYDYLKSIYVPNSIPNQQLPLFVYSFQDKEALGVACHLLEQSLKQVCNSYHNKWLYTLFQDIISSLFEDLPRYTNFSLNKNNDELIDLLKQVKINKLTFKQTNQPITILPESLSNQTTKIKFFPDYKPFKYSLFCRPVVEYSLTLFHEIYQRISNILKFEQKVNEIPVKDLLIDLIFKQLDGAIPESFFLGILKDIFAEDDALYFSPIITQVVQWRRLFFQYDQWSLELIIAWIGKILGQDTHQRIPEVKERLNLEVEGLLKKMMEDTSQTTRLCRVQTVQNVVFIHQFEIQNLYNIEQQQQQQ